MTLGVRVVAINAQDEVCLVRHTYMPGWHFPGGGVERAETCIDAAIKEAREEAGLIIAREDIQLVSIHANFESFPGDHVSLFVAKKWTLVSTSTAHEIAEYGFFALDALPQGTTKATKRRLAELAGAEICPNW